MGQAKLTFSRERARSFFAVGFDSAGGSAVEPQIVVPGGHVVQPANPTKASFTFDGWYLDGKKFDFAADTVDRDVTLTASWL